MTNLGHASSNQHLGNSAESQASADGGSLDLVKRMEYNQWMGCTQLQYLWDVTCQGAAIAGRMSRLHTSFRSWGVEMEKWRRSGVVPPLTERGCLLPSLHGLEMQCRSIMRVLDDAPEDRERSV